MTISRRAIIKAPVFFVAGAGSASVLPLEVSASQPSIDSALRSLYAAKRGILISLPRKDGHRDRALKHLEQAIHELKLYMTI